MYRIVNSMARLFALLGGGVLLLLIVLTCLSILGRTMNSLLHSDIVQSWLPGPAGILLGLGIGPINGDFELVEAGMAFAIFAFLPICQLHGAHASVDVFTARLPVSINAKLRAVIECVFAAVLVLIAVQLFAGLESKRNSGQTTFLLEFPIWWAYALSFSAAAVAAMVGVYVAGMRLLEAISGRTLLTDVPGAEH